VLIAVMSWPKRSRHTCDVGCRASPTPKEWYHALSPEYYVKCSYDHL